MIPNNKIENNNERSKPNILDLIEKGECIVDPLYIMTHSLWFDICG